MVSMEKIERKFFEEYYRELLKKMYKELDEYWKNYNLQYYKNNKGRVMSNLMPFNRHKRNMRNAHSLKSNMRKK